MFGTKKEVKVEDYRTRLGIPGDMTIIPLKVGVEQALDMAERLTSCLRTDVEKMNYSAFIETDTKTIEVIVKVKSHEEDTSGERP